MGQLSEALDDWPVNWPDTAELAEKAERHRPIPIPWPDSDQCLQTAMAALLRQPVDAVPPRRWAQKVSEWLAEVSLAFGVEFEILGRERLPHPGAWVAIVDVPSGGTHAVPAIGGTSGDPHYPRAALDAEVGLVMVEGEEAA